jgi:hypothetical protein
MSLATALGLVSAGLGFLADEKGSKDNSKAIIMGAENNLLSAQELAEFKYQYADEIMRIAGMQMEAAGLSASFMDLEGKSLQKQHYKSGEVSKALGTRGAYSEYENMKAALGNNIAAAAASGGLVEDSIKLIARTAEKGAYNAKMSVWEGDTRRNEERYKGDMAAFRGTFNAAMTMVNAKIAFDQAGVQASAAQFEAGHMVTNAERELEIARETGSQSRKYDKVTNILNLADRIGQAFS